MRFSRFSHINSEKSLQNDHHVLYHKGPTVIFVFMGWRRYLHILKEENVTF